MKNLKKVFVLFLVPVLFGCNNSSKQPQDDSLKMSQYNSALAGFSKVELTTKSIVDGVTLNGAYTSEVNNETYNVSYSYEVFSKIELTASPENYISTVSGSYTFANNSKNNVVGEDANLPFEVISLKGFSFVNEQYKDVQVNEDGVVLANIVDFAKVFSLKGTYSEAFVNLYLSNSKASKMLFSFKKGNVATVFTYTFTY